MARSWPSKGLRKRLAVVAAAVALAGTALLPALHLLTHRPDHAHGPGGVHLHGDGAAHAPETELVCTRRNPWVSHRKTSCEPARKPPPADIPWEHGEGALEHLALALAPGTVPPDVPPALEHALGRPAAAPALPHPSSRRAPAQARAPPSTA